MDILSHSLWSWALFKLTNIRLKKKKFKFWPAAFWGIFPDLFAFVIPFILGIFALISGKTSLPNPIDFSATNSSFPYYHLSEILYNISHSLIIFLIIFLLVWLIFRKPIWIMFGWILHILIDIPTHIKGYFATPILWPISDFKINGIAYWREPWVMIVDAILLIIIYLIIFYKEKKK